jgi:hypothetical protein
MIFKSVVGMSVSFILLAVTSAEAQRSSGRSGRGGLPPETVADLSKAALKKIKLAKPQTDSVKLLNRSYEDKVKELTRLAAMASPSRGGGSSRGGGPGSRSGGGNETPTGGPSVSSSLRTAIDNLHTEFLAQVRGVVTVEQQPVFDANLAAYRKKREEAAAKLAARARGGA